VTETASTHSSPAALLSGPIDSEVIARFRREAFRSVDDVERLRDWLANPGAKGLPRALALWALGRHKEALPLLQEHKDTKGVPACIARSHLALGNPTAAEKALPAKPQDPEEISALLESVAAQRDPERFAAVLERLGGTLSPLDRTYFAGWQAELEGRAEQAIARYDEVLAQDARHRGALFRLAVNVDLRGEDEEARELYERLLLVPPVNAATVMNLGVLYEDIGNYRRAMQCFDLVLQAAPENARARLYRRDAAAALNMYYDEDQERREDKRNRILRTPINDFELSVRSRNCLAKMNIRTLGDLVRKTEAELLSYKNFGETSLLEIKEILRNKGLRLGMTAEELMTRDLGEPAEVAAVGTEEMPDPNSPDPARRPVTELDLSVRSRRIIDLLKIKTIGDLANKTDAELLACPNFGQTSLNEIKTKLEELGLSLRG
jgi:DNA-directed RNA polymerase subunit alpha